MANAQKAVNLFASGCSVLNKDVSSTFIHELKEYQKSTRRKIVPRESYVLLVLANLPKVLNIWDYGQRSNSCKSICIGLISTQQECFFVLLCMN